MRALVAHGVEVAGKPEVAELGRAARRRCRAGSGRRWRSRRGDAEGRAHRAAGRRLKKSPIFSCTSLYLAGIGMRSSLPNTATGQRHRAALLPGCRLPGGRRARPRRRGQAPATSASACALHVCKRSRHLDSPSAMHRTVRMANYYQLLMRPKGHRKAASPICSAAGTLVSLSLARSIAWIAHSPTIVRRAPGRGVWRTLRRWPVWRWPARSGSGFRNPLSTRN